MSLYNNSQLCITILQACINICLQNKHICLIYIQILNIYLYKNATFFKITGMYSAYIEVNMQELRKISNGFILITQLTDRL